MAKVIPVLLSGGAGSRLWPLSREAQPKQLLPLLSQATLLQETARRVADHPLFAPLIVVANVEHRFAVAEQLRAIGQSAAHIILEPLARNTAPAAAVAALTALEADPESLILLMPADHAISDPAAFQRSIESGVTAAEGGAFVLFGIRPTEPATGYGYIHVEAPLRGAPGVHEVRGFKEKPDRSTAESYVRTGEYAWNSGIFLLPAKQFIDELSRLEPDMLEACQQALNCADQDSDFTRLNYDAFATARSVSIDYAVMERTTRAAVVPSDFPWSDIGSWSALWDIGSKDSNATVAIGSVITLDTAGSYVRSEGPLVATLGLQDLIVVATQDAVLVAAKDRDQDVKQIVDRLKR